MQLTLSEQQLEMRHAYLDGAPGIVVSGLVWIAAALVYGQGGFKPAMWTLLIGGALISPIALVVTKLMGRTAKTAKANALNQLGMASTIWLILGCAMAYGLSLQQPQLFFPAVLATIGCRYLVFTSLYGMRVFSVMGVSLIAGAGLAFYLTMSPVFAAWLGGFIELIFAVFVFASASKPAVTPV